MSGCENVANTHLEVQLFIFVPTKPIWTYSNMCLSRKQHTFEPWLFWCNVYCVILLW